MKSFISIFSLFVITIIYFQCTSTRYLHDSQIIDRKYDTEFPVANSSQTLEWISRSVLKIFTTAYYVNYHFKRADLMKKEDIYRLNLAKKSRARSYFTKSASGTVTLIAKKKQAFLFLTCKHILDYPDTLYYYYTDSKGAFTDIIKSVAIKVRQSNQIPELGEVIDVASDKKLDVALVGYIQPKQFVTEKRPTVERLRPIQIPMGEPDRLQFGSFVYVIGYPQGIKMITSGLVSIYHNSRGKRIVLDALFNQGASGAIVLAIMDGVPNFELIGIANAVSAEDEFYLIPEKGKDWDPTVEYKGKMYVRHRKLINYGITFIIPIDKILDFLKAHSKEIIRRGFPLPELERKYLFKINSR